MWKCSNIALPLLTMWKWNCFNLSSIPVSTVVTGLKPLTLYLFFSLPVPSAAARLKPFTLYWFGKCSNILLLLLTICKWNCFNFFLYPCANSGGSTQPLDFLPISVPQCPWQKLESNPWPCIGEASVLLLRYHCWPCENETVLTFPLSLCQQRWLVSNPWFFTILYPPVLATAARLKSLTLYWFGKCSNILLPLPTICKWKLFKLFTLSLCQ